jgi:hypothetical protein
MAIGDLPDISIRQLFNSRRELYDAGVHRALQAGIVGSPMWVRSQSFSPAAMLMMKITATS